MEVVVGCVCVCAREHACVRASVVAVGGMGALEVGGVSARRRNRRACMLCRLMLCISFFTFSAYSVFMMQFG